MQNAKYNDPIKSDMINSSWTLNWCYFWKCSLYYYSHKLFLEMLSSWEQPEGPPVADMHYPFPWPEFFQSLMLQHISGNLKAHYTETTTYLAHEGINCTSFSASSWFMHSEHNSRWILYSQGRFPRKQIEFWPQLHLKKTLLVQIGLHTLSHYSEFSLLKPYVVLFPLEETAKYGEC